MQPVATRRIDSLLALPRGAKKTLAVMTDASLCVLTVWLAICFRFETWVSLSGYQWLAVLLSIVLVIPLLTAFGFYHTVIRFAGKQTITAALRAMGIYALIYSAVFTVYGFPLVPRTIGILQPLLLLIGLALVRLLASQLLNEQLSATHAAEKLPSVLIYGAGNSGQQLAASLRANGERQVIGFLDDNVGLHKARIAGIPVYGPREFPLLSQRHQIRDVLLAMPSLSRSKRNDIIKLLGQSSVTVRTLPSLKDLASGKISEDDLRELDIEDLLGRDPVTPIPELLSRNIEGKVVMVTGAGGSIGSELCRQIARLNPRHLVLFDLNELALYNILEELSEGSVEGTTKFRLSAVLANVMDTQHLERLMHEYHPQTIYHAAAYKHVPLVESNAISALHNNVLGTLHLARAALACQVDVMVLISTDKAVRPTNIMGATKRMAEMCLQALADQHKHLAKSTRFCVVRFGNVLGSSGSVIPKFRKQIKSGGPLTLTHPEVTRYFMTIPEAAQLVLQASAIHHDHTQGAFVYLLDMGQSVRILDMAKTMIQLSGLTVRDAANPDGDIALQIVGLRPGEKLYEELLTQENSQSTSHPKIHFAAEDFQSVEIILNALKEIELLYQISDHSNQAQFISALRSRLKTIVELREPPYMGKSNQDKF
jgi:FlaA1/EpsC-like NDP-sugar epimerase